MFLRSTPGMFLAGGLIGVALTLLFTLGGDDGSSERGAVDSDRVVPGAEALDKSESAGAAGDAEQAPGQPAAKIRLVDGRAVPEPRRLAFSPGDAVRILISSDSAQTVRVSGYGATATVNAGAEAELAFTAKKTGVFEIKLQGSGRRIGEIAVQADEQPAEESAPSGDEANGR